MPTDFLTLRKKTNEDEDSAAYLERATAAILSATPEAISDLIEQVEAVASAQRATAERARKRAMNPTLSFADAVEAREARALAAFYCDRLQVAMQRLRERRDQIIKLRG
jgi:hypothetical protein